MSEIPPLSFVLHLMTSDEIGLKNGSNLGQERALKTHRSRENCPRFLSNRHGPFSKRWIYPWRRSYILTVFIEISESSFPTSMYSLISLCPPVLRERLPKQPTLDDQCDIVSSVKAPFPPSLPPSTRRHLGMSRFPLLPSSYPKLCCSSPIPFIACYTYHD